MAIVAIAVVAIVLQQKQARRRKLLSHRRRTTLQLLQDHVTDSSLEDALLPYGSIDFGPESVCVAAGAGGRIYRCHATPAISAHGRWHNDVALKEIFAMMDLVSNKQGIQEFASELGVLLRLQHPHIVAFLGVYFHPETRDGLDMERWFMVTQFAPNGSLERHLGLDFTTGPSLHRRLQWVREIAQAVHYLHRENFVHRDLKPQNVLVDEQWNCLLADFGLARSIASTRSLTTKIGTVQFMPPEALDGLVDYDVADFESGNVLVPEPATLKMAKAWDVYSLAVLVAALFNRTDAPHPAMKERRVIVQVLARDLRPQLPVELSQEFHALLQRMWDKNPQVRPTMAGVLDHLDQLQGALAFVPAELEKWASGLGLKADSHTDKQSRLPLQSETKVEGGQVRLDVHTPIATSTGTGTAPATSFRPPTSGLSVVVEQQESPPAPPLPPIPARLTEGTTNPVQ